MSIFASILRSVYKLSGAKKAFALPEDVLRKEIEKQNRHRGVFTPTDRKAYYETIAVNGFPCLIVREHPKPSERAILYFFGGGMVIGPDKGDLPVMRKLCRETGCDVWFPFIERLHPRLFRIVPRHFTGGYNDDVSRLRQRLGLRVVVRRDPQSQRTAGGKAAGTDISAAIQPNHFPVTFVNHRIGFGDTILHTEGIKREDRKKN